MARFSLSKYLNDALEVNKADLTTGYDASQINWIYESMGMSGRLQLALWALNNLERFDPILEPITQVVYESDFHYTWSEGKWKKGNMATRSEGGKRYTRRLSIPSDTYSYELPLARKDVKRWSLMESRYGEMGNPMQLFDDELMKAIVYFKKLERALALKALTNVPASEASAEPTFYRDTSGFSASNQVVPPKNGKLVFTNAESHYIALASYADDMLYNLAKKVKDKAPNTEVMPVIYANTTSWKKFRDLFSKDELEAFTFRKSLSLDVLAPEDYDADAIFVTVEDSDMDDDYFICVDMNRRLLAKKEAFDPVARGVQVNFNTLNDVMRLRGMDALRTNPGMIRAEADNEIVGQIGSSMQGAINFIVDELGYGIVDPSAGAVLYAGGVSYVNPTWDNV